MAEEDQNKLYYVGVRFAPFPSIFSTGKDGAPKDYYTLDCILYLMRNVNLPHSKYVRQAAVSSLVLMILHRPPGYLLCAYQIAVNC